MSNYNKIQLYDKQPILLNTEDNNSSCPAICKPGGVIHVESMEYSGDVLEDFLLMMNEKEECSIKCGTPWPKW